MAKRDEILEVYTEKKDIQRIIDLIKSKKIEKTNHFLISAIIGRDVSEELVEETLPKFEKVRVINKRKHIKGDIGYDLYYELSNSRTLELCFIPREGKILLINAILKLRKWQNFIRPINPRF